MRLFIYAVLLLLLAALYIYFLGTPWLASLTGISPRAISLTAGFAIVLFGIAGMMIGRLSAQRGRRK
jgi:biotin transporter BioY